MASQDDLFSISEEMNDTVDVGNEGEDKEEEEENTVEGIVIQD